MHTRSSFWDKGTVPLITTLEEPAQPAWGRCLTRFAAPVSGCLLDSYPSGSICFSFTLCPVTSWIPWRPSLLPSPDQRLRRWPWLTKRHTGPGFPLSPSPRFPHPAFSEYLARKGSAPLSFTVLKLPMSPWPPSPMPQNLLGQRQFGMFSPPLPPSAWGHTCVSGRNAASQPRDSPGRKEALGLQCRLGAGGGHGRQGAAR